MRFVCAVAGFVATLAMGVQAQQSGVTPPPTHVQIVAIGVNCPAGMLSARQRTAGGATMWTTAQEDLGKRFEGRAPGSMGVHVDFDSPMNPVQSVELSVSYLPLNLRLMPVAQGAEVKDPQKTFVLKQEAARKMDADLLVGPASSIETVHLVSATFADGSVWRAPNDDTCSVEPSRFLLVDAR